MTSSLSFSQVGYPKKIVIGKDTVIAVTQKQVKQLNILHFDYKECNEIKDSLIANTKKDSILIESQKKYSVSLENQLSTQGKILLNTTDVNLQLNKDLKDAQKLYNRQKIKTGIVGGMFTVALGALVTLLIVH
jgi:hypothetical protein